MNKKVIATIIFCIITVVIVIFLFFRQAGPDNKNLINASSLPDIYPDYTDITIPANIAPLNFYIKEKGVYFYIKLSGKKGSPIEIAQKSASIQIPASKWRALLEANKSGEINIDVFVKGDNKQWTKFNTIIDKVAAEPIDGFLAYRLINSGHVLWDKMGLYVRNLSNFEEKPIITNNLLDNNCVNCHSFYKNKTENMLFHIRGSLKGTVIKYGNSIKKINTATPYTMTAAVYPSWHPGGKLIAFSVNRINQSFYASGNELIEVYDKASDLIVLDPQTNEVSTSPKISTSGGETYPNWSPDGKYLYYCLSPKWSQDIPVDSFKYSLMRIEYNIETREWGKVDTIISSKETGKSITFPRVSPDGKYLLFTMSNHGVFSIFFPSSDLYMLNLETGKYAKLPVNSEYVESFHSWSGNSRWFVFSSKRMNGLHARPFIAYFDKDGNAGKPFVVPSLDPLFYDTFLKNYNVPELVEEPTFISPLEFENIAREEAVKATFDPNVNVDALSGATWIKK